MAITIESFTSPSGQAGDPQFMSLLDDILYQLSVSRGEETEGQFAQAEALFENAALVLEQIQNQVPADQRADVLAEYLRESGFSSHVVEQTLGIPREQVNAVLAQAGYSETGQPLEEANLQNQLLTSSVTGQSDVFFDYVDLAEENKVPLTQAEFADLVAKTNAATSNEELSQILSDAGIFHDTASLDAETGMDMGGRLMDRITITDGGGSVGGEVSSADIDSTSAASTIDSGSIVSGEATDVVSGTDTSGMSDIDGLYKDIFKKYEENPELYNYDQVAAQIFEAIGVETDPAVRQGLIDAYKDYGYDYDPNKPVLPVLKSDEQLATEKAQADAQAQADRMKAAILKETSKPGDFLSVLNDLIDGKITLAVMRDKVNEIYGAGSVAASQAITNATTMINTGSTNVDDVVASVTNIGGQGNTYTPENKTGVDDGGLADSDITDITDSDITDGDITDGDITDGDITDGGTFNGGGLGDGTGNGTGDGTGDGTGGGRDAVILAASQNSNTVEQMFSKELFEPKFRELDNVVKNLGMIQSIAGGFGRIV